MRTLAPSTSSIVADFRVCQPLLASDVGLLKCIALCSCSTFRYSIEMVDSQAVFSGDNTCKFWSRKSHLHIQLVLTWLTYSSCRLTNMLCSEPCRRWNTLGSNWRRATSCRRTCTRQRWQRRRLWRLYTLRSRCRVGHLRRRSRWMRSTFRLESRSARTSRRRRPRHQSDCK